MRRSLVGTVILTMTCRFAAGQVDSVQKWQEDLAYLRQKLVSVHPEPFHSLSEKDFDRMLTDLRAELPKLSENQITLRVSKILASLGQGDGHSGLRLADPRFGFHIVPLGFYWFTDGIFVKAAPPPYREALGARLLAIDGTPVEAAFSKILEITEGDNDMTRRAWGMRALAIPEVLKALEIAYSSGPAEYVLRKTDGAEIRLRPAPVGFRDKIEWTDPARDETKPLYLRHAPLHPYDPHDLHTYFWYEYFPGEKLATHLDIHTNAIFVGEPTGGSPNHFGDAMTIKLPNSGVPVRIATLRWQDSDPRDRRPWVAPDIAAELSSADYFAGRDPPLAAIREYQPVEALPARLRRAALQGGKIEAERVLSGFRADPRHKYAEPEREINRVGYELMREKKTMAAIAIFQLNTEAFPRSWNVWDSLGEALADAGHRQEAIRAYERALELNPEAGSAVEALKRLRGERPSSQP
jgi:tetratricopeptide (TPR) repeat protein